MWIPFQVVQLEYKAYKNERRAPGLVVVVVVGLSLSELSALLNCGGGAQKLKTKKPLWTALLLLLLRLLAAGTADALSWLLVLCG